MQTQSKPLPENFDRLKSSSWRMSTWWMPDRRASVQRSLLRLLAVAHAERLDLSSLIYILARENRGIAGRRLRRLAHRLTTGTPLIEALEQTPDALADEDVLTLRFARESGTMAAALNDLVERASTETHETHTRLVRIMTYFGGVAVVGWMLLSFLMLAVAPSYSKLADEYGMKLHWEFDSLTAVISQIVVYLPIAILIGICLTLASWTLRPFRRFRRAFASRWVGPVAQLRTARLLRNLALAVAAGRPIPSALSTLARHHFDAHVRSKLLFARNEVEQGAEPWQSLSSAGLITSRESQALASSSTLTNRVWLLNRLARWKEESTQQRGAVLVSLLHPGLVLGFGILVLWIALAFFGFVTQLITSLA